MKQKPAKKKKPATAAVNGVPAKSPKSQAKLNGHSADSTPAQSSEDSSSDSEKETVRSVWLRISSAFQEVSSG